MLPTFKVDLQRTTHDTKGQRPADLLGHLAACPAILCLAGAAAELSWIALRTNSTPTELPDVPVLDRICLSLFRFAKNCAGEALWCGP